MIRGTTDYGETPAIYYPRPKERLCLLCWYNDGIETPILNGARACRRHTWEYLRLLRKGVLIRMILDVLSDPGVPDNLLLYTNLKETVHGNPGKPRL